jgi:hypothetical protein
MSLPLWWRRNHHTPWSIHAWEIWGYGLREDPNNQDESSWANHDHRLRMRMTWAWWDGDLVLLASTSPFTFTINLYFLSLVLPCSCFLERGGGKKWESESSWELHKLMIYSPLSCLWHVGPWASGGQLILHSLLPFCHLADGPIDLSDYLVALSLWGLNPSI